MQDVFTQQQQPGPWTPQNAMGEYAARWTETAVIVILTLYGIGVCCGCLATCLRLKIDKDQQYQLVGVKHAGPVGYGGGPAYHDLLPPTNIPRGP